MFLTFEGIEGSGKWYQARALTARLQAHGVPVRATHEPGGTPLGDQIRELVLLRTDLGPAERAEALLMCASRAQLVRDVIRPALERGEVVVCDRFADSTLAYQGFGRGLDSAALRAVISFATAGLKPEMTMLLDLPVQVGLARKHEQDAEWNRFEAEVLAFHNRVRSGYHQLARDEPQRWRCFDGSKSRDALSEEIWLEVRERLGFGMKLVVAVVQSEDANGLLTQLSHRGFGATRIKTAGGFLREANATLFIGVEDHDVDAVVHTIRENCTTRQQQITAIPAVMEPGEFFLPYPVDVEVGGATIFVLDVARFERV